MKSQSAFLSKFCLIFAFILLFSCDRNETQELETNQLQEAPYSVNHVSLRDIPNVSSFLESRAGKNIFSGSSKGDSGDAIFDTEDILFVRDSLEQGNYSLRFSYPDTPENIFYNLVISVSGSGEITEPYIYKFTCNESQFAEFSDNGYDMAYFAGGIELHRFDSFFADLDFLNGKCDDAGDPCAGGTISNPVFSYSGDGSNLGIAQSGFVPITDYDPGSSNHTLSVNLYHTPPDGSGTFLYSSGGNQVGTCQHLNGCTTTLVVKSDAGINAAQKAAKTGCDDCGSGPIGGSGVNTGNPLVEAFLGSFLSSSDMNWLNQSQNAAIKIQITAYALRNASTTEVKDFVKWFIDFERLPNVPCGVGHDCVKSIQVMASGLRKFHGTEGKLIADYFDSLVSDFNSFTKSDLQTFYDTAKAITKRFNDYGLATITGAYIRGTAEILSMVLLEVGAPAALKLLKKIPKPWVTRGSKLNTMVKNVGLLGSKGSGNNIRILRVNSPISRSKELFNSMTKHAISKTTKSNGTIVAEMGNGNRIKYRPISASQSNAPATIDLEFSNIWTKTREVKFFSK